MASGFSMKVCDGVSGGPGYGDLLLASLRDGHHVYFDVCDLEGWGILFRPSETENDYLKKIKVRIVQVRRRDGGWENDAKVTDQWTIEGELMLGGYPLGFMVRGDYRTDTRQGEFTITEREPRDGDRPRSPHELAKSEWLWLGNSIFAHKLRKQEREKERKRYRG